MEGQTGTMLKEGTRVVVTAGGSGIGHAIAKAFVDHGARVHICDVSDEMLSRGLSALPGASGTLADVADRSDVDRLFDDAEVKLGGLDVLVNNAGIAGPTAPVEEIAPDEWTQTIAINLTGTFLSAQAAARAMRELGHGGAVVLIGSINSQMALPGAAAYCASKGGVVMLGRALAVDLAAGPVADDGAVDGTARLVECYVIRELGGTSPDHRRR